ncbi:hypothetical protein ECC02_003462 [Trypanosoma cruzi]|uniref:Protein kinase domain-containing protein n=1 Tax=Trypanosoma cruzi TaxID=5693 RepID=A0A7J6YA55_TRYCR|nr:hypothetical protein ECC02_003462 [Trypanosoma cruzi]
MTFSPRGTKSGEFAFDVCKLKLGSGGSGTVFLAQHHCTRELVAVKRLFAKGAAECGRSPLQCARLAGRRCYHHHHHHHHCSCVAHHGKRPTSARTATLTFEKDDDDDNLLRDVDGHVSCSSDLSNNSQIYDDDMHDDSDGIFEEKEDEEMVEVKGVAAELEKENISEEGREKKSSPAWGRIPSVARSPCESTILQYLGPHHHIVKFLGSYTSPSRVTFFAMELMDSDVGRELRAANTAFMKEDIACPLLYSVASAIAHLHRRGVAHRDIKPSNILLRRVNAAKMIVNAAEQCVPAMPGAGLGSTHIERRLNNVFFSEEKEEEQKYFKAALGDFSAAHFMHESTKVGSGRGTLYYKSPEQLMGRAEDYFACDMWALGCTLFELSTGSVAFCGSTDLQVLHQIYAKLGTEFQFYPEKIRETTLFDSLSAPSTAFLELLKGLLALDPKKRLTASEALKHPFFDPIRHKYGVDSENMEVTFPLRPRCCRPVDTTRFTFRPVCSTPAKRSQRAIAGVFSRVKCGLNLSDPNLSCSGRRCSVWSSSFSGSLTPRAASTCMKSHHESINASRRRSGGWGACSAAVPLSFSSFTPKAGGMSAQGKDDNPKTIGPPISPVALCFSPATSVKCRGSSMSANKMHTATATAAPAASTLATTVSPHGKMLRWTPSSKITLGNARTNLLFERVVLGGDACGGGCPTGPRVLLDDDSHSCRHDGDSPPVRKILFASPHQSLIYRLNDSSDNAESSAVAVDEP